LNTSSGSHCWNSSRFHALVKPVKTVHYRERGSQQRVARLFQKFSGSVSSG
jgi:hypothetical protein